MITTYLKFPDRATAWAVLPTTIGDDGSSAFMSDAVIDGQYCAIDVCFGTGTLMAATGDLDGEGNPILTALPGYHANVLSETVPPSLVPYVIDPVSPDIVFG